MKIANEKLLDLAKGLNAVSKLGGAKFAYAVARNLTKVNSEISSLNTAFAPTEEYIAFDKERATLAESNAVKIDGKPKIEGDHYVIEDQAKFDKELEVLKEKHKKTVDEREKQDNEFKEIMKQEVEIDLYTIPASYLPENITAEQINGILLIIEEEKK